jgi:hypothetical protein
MVISEFGSEISSVQIRRGVLEDAAALAELVTKTSGDTFSAGITSEDLYGASGSFDKRFVMRSVT